MQDLTQEQIDELIRREQEQYIQDQDELSSGLDDSGETPPSWNSRYTY